MEGYVLKGLILSGGKGTRLRPITYTSAKQLVPVANKPVLFYGIEALVEAGITDIGIVVGDTHAEIRAAVGDGSKFGSRVTYIPQDAPRGLAHAVKISQDFIGTDPFVMYLGDNLLNRGIVEFVDQFVKEKPAAQILLTPVPDPQMFGVAELNGDKVHRLVEKPKEPKSNLALVGIYLFRPSVFDAISKIIELGGKVKFTRLTSWWLDTGKKDDMLLANDTVLDDWLEAKNDGTVDAASKISGRVSIGKGAVIERSTLRGPIVVGDGARIVDSRIGPFTAIGDGVVIERSTVDHSVMMTGSRIIDIPRLEDSLIGKRVLVHPGASRHGALSLMVGDDCVVELSTE